MLILKATKDTLKDLNVKPTIVDILDPFLSWHVNYFTLYGKKHYVFMNDLSRMSLTVTGIRSNQSNKVKDIFIENLKRYLRVEQIAEALANSYIKDCNEVILTKTDSRSVLSTQSEIMLVMKTLERDKKDFKDQDKRHKWNNRFIYKPIDYQYPIDVFINELKSRYKNNG
ncbi:DUF6933 domain-containing protein [Paenibacillus marinisediminis]